MATFETDIGCINCPRDLRYSIPPQPEDTTTKRKFEQGNVLCNICTEKQIQERKTEAARKKEIKRQKQENIKRREESKVQTFDRKWRDVDENGSPLRTIDDDGIQIVNLPDHRRLMWIYIRGPIRDPKSGYLATEEMKVIKREKLENIIQSARQERQKIQSDLASESTSKETADKEMKEINDWEKREIKKLVSTVNRLHSKANKEWEQKPEEKWERMVKKPNYRDDEGNKAPRYHLLSDKVTYRERHAMRQRDINNIQRIDNIEDKISDKQSDFISDNDGSMQVNSK